jgi:mannose-6-phosphate isomerase-like protein (cupin superfamily)
LLKQRRWPFTVRTANPRGLGFRSVEYDEVIMQEKVNLAEKFASFSDHWSPKIAGELNDSYVKLVKLRGEFVWHHHDLEDELFLVVKGTLRIGLRDAAGVERELRIAEGEFIIVPHGTEHLPIADDEVHVVLLEPKTTLNTGNVANERTVAKLDRI